MYVSVSPSGDGETEAQGGEEVPQRAAAGLASNVWLQSLLVCVLLINGHQ